MGGAGGTAGTTDSPITLALVMFSNSLVKTYISMDPYDMTLYVHSNHNKVTGVCICRIYYRLESVIIGAQIYMSCKQLSLDHI